MSVIWSMKQKNGDKWESIPLNAVAGKTVRESLEWIAGQEIVAEFVISGGKYYFCGTENWKQRMAKKGKAVLAAEAIELLEKVNPDLLREVCPRLAEVEEAFPGCRLEQVTLEL